MADMKDILAQWKLIVAAVGVLSGIGWCAERDGRLRAEGRAEVADIRVDSLTGVVEAEKAVSADTRAELQRVKMEADSANARNERAISDLRTSRPQVIERVVHEAGPDSAVVREAVAEVAESYEAEIGVLRAALVQRDLVIEAQATRIVALETENAAQASLIAALRDAATVRAGAGPGFFDSTPVKVAAMFGAAWVGYEIGKGR